MMSTQPDTAAGVAGASPQDRARPGGHAPWLDALLFVARHFRLDVSGERVRVALAWREHEPLDARLRAMARDMGLSLREETLSAGVFDPWRLPVIAGFRGGQVGVIESVGADGRVGVRLAGEHGMLQALPADDLLARVERIYCARPEVAVPDRRVDDYIEPYQDDWFWSIVKRDWRRYLDVMLASLVANVLALAGMTFSMQVYDRVIPAQSEPTLWVLFGGVTIAIAFEFCMRLARTRISDLIGKRADLRISDRVFGHALRIRSDAASKSTGSFIAQLRELEQIREMITSTTLGAMADLPFFLLFVVVLWYVGGALALVPLVAVPLLIVPGLLAQRPLAKLSQAGMREASIRNAMLVEAVLCLQDIKLLRAEARFQNQWNHLSATAATIGMRQRFLSGLLTTWAQALQTLVYALVILVGCFAVMKGDMTTGALVGLSILSSRTIAPLAQLSGVMARWQQAKVARKGLDELMKRPVDHPEHAKRLHRPAIAGAYDLADVRFRYGDGDGDGRPALEVGRLRIRAGERIALLGRNGAGKSTLLQLLSGLHAPQQGDVLLDSLKLSLIDPYDVRRDVAYLSQHANLFYGTLRENLTMGRPHASDDEIVEALKLAGALDFVQRLPHGLDHMVLEGGRGLSGGQRQLLLLARVLIRAPRVVLLDEPSASLDELSEQHLLNALGPWLEGRTLVVATHRPALLRWVERIVVVDNGRVVLDGSRDAVLDKLRQPAAAAPKTARSGAQPAAPSPSRPA